VAAVACLVLADVAVMQGWTLTLAKQLGTLEPTAVGILRGGVPAMLVCVALLWRGSVRFGVMATILMLGSLFTAVGGPVLHRERTFFGVHRVTQNPDATWNVLHHGTTLHGVQIKSESLPPPPEGLPPINPETLDRLFYDNRRNFTRNQRIAMSYLIPSTYYHPTGPIGDVFRTMRQPGRLTNAAFIGMGTGSLAAYGRPGMAFDFFEIDPAVVRIAGTPEFFSYLSSSKADQGRAIFGDGRVQMARQPDASYDLIVIDAFSSDAIPVHLVTREAMEIYRSKLRKGGIIAFHISNRYFDLKPVLARLAALDQWEAFYRDDSAMMKEDLAEAKKESLWVVVCERAADFDLAGTPNWPRLPDRKEYPTWTDDYSNVLSVFVGW
jgi:SAM-dependent methyltransferase